MSFLKLYLNLYLLLHDMPVKDIGQTSEWYLFQGKNIVLVGTDFKYAHQLRRGNNNLLFKYEVSVLFSILLGVYIFVIPYVLLWTFVYPWGLCQSLAMLYDFLCI